MSSFAIVPVTGPEAQQPNGAPFPARAGAQLSEEEGGVYAFLALARYDPRLRLAAYALRVVNATSEPALCRCYGIERGGEPVPAYPEPIVAQPRGVLDTSLSVRTENFDALSRVVVDVVGRGASLRVEAPAPARGTANAWTWARWVAGLLVVLAAIVVAALASMPRVSLVDAPARATAGSPLLVPYAWRGMGEMQYELAAPDGRLIAAGHSGERVGVLSIALPPARAAIAYRLRVRAIGPLGRDARVATVLAAPAPAPLGAYASSRGLESAPLIGELSVAPTPVEAGGSMRVYYTATGTRGRVWLLDLGGKVWASGPFAVDGTTALRVPESAAGRQMRVVLQVQDGARRAMSSVGVVVVPGRSAKPEAMADAPRAEDPAQTAGIELSRSQAEAGESVRVQVLGAHDDAVITLMDGAGHTIAQGDASGAEDAVALIAPAVTAPTRFYVVASITRGLAQTSVVRKLVVVPVR